MWVKRFAYIFSEVHAGLFMYRRLIHELIVDNERNTFSNGMGGKSVTNHGGEHTNKLNTQTQKQKTQTETTFRNEHFPAEIFWGKKTFYHFGMGGKV